ncbi:MAG: tetratricopeptide repeat protein [Gammaproteobacteria bacterium]
MHSTTDTRAFVLDVADERLWRGDQRVALTPKAFALLRYLVEHPNVLLTKEVLLENVWPDVYVVEQVLRHNIQELRQALGDNSDVPRYIETVRGRGYRFIGVIAIRNGAPAPVAPPVIPDPPAVPTHDAGAIVAPDPPAVPTSAESAPSPTTAAWSIRRWSITTVLSVALLAGVVWYFYPRPPAPALLVTQTIPIKHRIAVLPFINISQNADNEYFADGMTEEMISKLSRIGQLQVIARTSAMAYKGTAKKIDEIGRELNIGTVLEGSVRKAGDKVRITAQLIDVQSQAHLWSQDYDRDLKDIFTIQTDVTQQVVDALRISLLSNEQRQVEKRGTDDLEAYNLYLLGLYELNKHSKETLNKSIDYFEQAIAKHPRYAQAYAWMATAYDNLGWFGLLPQEESFPIAKAKALKALEIDDTNAEAYGVMGDMYALEWNWPAVEHVLRRALEFNPNSAWAHDIYGISYFGAMGRYEEGIAHLRQAVALDPVAPIYRHDLAWVISFTRRYDEAIAEFQKAAAIEPDFANLHRGLGELYAYQGKYDQSIAAMQKLVELSKDTPYSLASLGWAYGVAGRREEALTILKTLQEKARHEAVDASDFARIYLGLGDKEQALTWLEKTYRERSGGWVLVWAKGFPFFDPLRSEPRFIELLKKLGLEK